MKSGKMIFSLLGCLLSCQACLSYKWSVTAQLDNLNGIVTSNDVQRKNLQEKCAENNGEFDPSSSTCHGVLVVTEASGNDRIGCYLSFWIYGGWCWFVGPEEVDKEFASKKAREKMNFPVKIDYLGRR